MSLHSRYWRSALLAIAMASLLTVAGCGGGSSNNPSPEDISGSGKDISGTGITTGTVDGFGSVIVNGVHFDTEGTEFSIEDMVGVQSDLSVGQVVTIVGSVENGEGTAVSITYDQNLEGPVSSVDSVNERFVALGQTVIVNSLTIFEKTSLDTLMVGDIVEISGVNDADGNIRASYVGLRDTVAASVELRGVVSNLNTTTRIFNINSLLISYDDTTDMDLDDAIQNGMVVEVEGMLAGSTLVASEIEENEDAYKEDDELEIEGFVTNVASELSQFNVAGVTVQYSGDTEFENGTAASLALNAAVEVDGIINSAGVLEASEIEFEERVSIELAGLVQAVDSAAGSVTVFGVMFTVDTSSRIRDERDDIELFSLSDISIGDYVEIKAINAGQGQYVAAGLERTETDTEVALEASIESIDESGHRVVALGVTIDLSDPELDIEDLSKEDFFATLAVGDVVDVEGTFDEGIFLALEIELEDDEDDSIEENKAGTADESEEDEVE